MDYLGKYDVIVVGGRVAGAASAIHIARAGLKVLLIEQSRRLPPIVSTHLLHPYGLASLYRLCKPDQLEAGLHPKIPYMSIFFQDNVLRARVTSVGDIDYMICPDRDWLDNLLLEQCVSEPNIQVVTGFKINDLQKNPHGKATGVMGRLNGKPTLAEGSLIIGADGKQSTIANLANSKIYHQQQMIRSGFYGYFKNFEGLEGPSVEFYVGRDQYYAFPMKDGLTCLIASTHQEKDHLFGESIEKGLREVFRQSPYAERAKNIELYGTAMGIKAKAHTTFIRQCVGDGWALIGDASMHTDPMFGQGIGLALRTAEALANVVIAGHYKKGDVTALIGKYGRWRNGSLWDLYGVIAGISRDPSWGTQPWERLLQKRAMANPDTAGFIYSMMNQLVRPIGYFTTIIPALVTGRGVRVKTNQLPKLPYSDFLPTVDSRVKSIETA